MSNKGSRAPLAGRKNEDWEDEAAKELAEAEDDAPKPSAAALAAAALLAGENDEEDDEDDEDEEGVMVRILPYVFIGDAYAACNEALLKEHGITHIVNLVSDDVDNQFPDSISYLDVPCAATIDDPIDEHFEKVSKFILGVKEAEGKVLMHCIDGIELSPAFMSAYMLIASFEKHKKLPLKDAMAHVEKLKTDVCPNDGFISKLIALEKKLFGCVSMKLDRSGKMVNVGGGAPAYLGRGKGRKLGKKRGAMGGGRR